MPSTCKSCGSTELRKRGNGFYNTCRVCWNLFQKEKWYQNHDQSIARSRANYRRHSEKRVSESREYKAANRERYSLLEWFRKRGIDASLIPENDMQALVEMKKALNRSKTATKLSTSNETNSPPA